MPTPFHLNGRPIYKLSMGSLANFTTLLDQLKNQQNNSSWLVINQYAGTEHTQGKAFQRALQIGDYVYACVGSKQLWGIYRITGDWQPLPVNFTDKIDVADGWGYREAKLEVSPIKTDLASIKHIRKRWAPSGFSTFWRVTDLAKANSEFFERFFGRTLSENKAPSATPFSSSFPRNQILYGPPGTGKTFHTTLRAVALLESLTDKEAADQYPTEKRALLRQKFIDYRASGRIDFVTFHQAFTYEDFVEGIKPVLLSESEEETMESDSPMQASIQYEIRPGVFLRMCEYAAADPTSPYVLIIDEINRGNIANIFGELITLLEDDKRLGKPEEASARLPYSQELFSVPDNLYLLGTMNTADRSVEALDTALRRRFSFTEMPPRPELLSPHQMIVRLWSQPQYRNCPWDEQPYLDAETALYDLLGCPALAQKDQEPLWQRVLREGMAPETTEDILKGESMNGVNAELLLRAINSRLEQLLDHDHCLGHALLIGAQDFNGLREAFRRNILPLLQEYFFGDWGKIGLVLGDGFVKEVNDQKVGLKKFKSYVVQELNEKPVYRLVVPEDPAAFQAIYAA